MTQTPQDSADPLTETAGFFVDPAAIVWLGGEEPLDYLQRLSTNKLVDLDVGEGRFTVLTTDTGRAIDLLACYRGTGGVALITTSPASTVEVTEHLRGYVLFGDKVTVTDASNQVGLIRLVGPRALDIARTVTGIDTALSEPGSWVESGAGNASVWLLRHLEPGLGGVDLVLPRGIPFDNLVDKLRGEGLRAGSPSDLDRLRVFAGLPAHSAEIDRQSNPLELGLLDAIDFDKGCYIGQEVIARLANYEKIQRRLVRLRSKEALVAGMEVLPSASSGEGRRPRAGRITTAVSLADRKDLDEPLSQTGSGPDESEGAHAWVALALVPLSTRAGDRLERSTSGTETGKDPSSAGRPARSEIEVVAEIGRMPGENLPDAH